MLCALLGNVIKKYSTAKFKSKTSMRFFFNAVVAITCVAVFFIISGVPKISSFTLTLGILFGMITSVQFVFYLMAFETGPFSYTSVIVSLSTIIPALSGYFIWGESIAPIQIVGMILMLVCFALSVDFSKSDKKASGIWFLCVCLAFVTTGLIGVMQKWHQSSEYKAELDGFLIVAFASSFVFSAIGMLITTIRQKDKKEVLKLMRGDITAFVIPLMVVCGVCAAMNNKLNLYLSGVMDSAIFFPVVNGGGMILSTLASLVIFKEKFNAQKWLGIAVGVIAVILICNPF